MNRTVVGAVAAMLALTAGCTPTATAGGRGAVPAETYPSTQAWALNDGAVTGPEYRTAIDQAVACARAAGYQVSTPWLSPVDGATLLYDIEPAGDPRTWSRKVESCNENHLSIIEAEYIGGTIQVMQPELRTAVAACLRRHGVSPTGGETNVAEFVKATKGTGEPAAQCVTESLPKLYPQAPKTLKLRW